MFVRGERLGSQSPARRRMSMGKSGTIYRKAERDGSIEKDELSGDGAIDGLPKCALTVKDHLAKVQLLAD